MLLAIHEGVPGHYLQGAYANESASLARAVFASGTFAEGWAVYVTQVMMDLGYRDNEPGLWLTALTVSAGGKRMELHGEARNGA